MGPLSVWASEELMISYLAQLHIPALPVPYGDRAWVADFVYRVAAFVSSKGRHRRGTE